MSFTCQRDSYLKEVTSVITDIKYGCKLGKVKNGVEVELQDTILFPEGGGQNDDRGSIDGYPVLRITRRGKSAIHFVHYSAKESEQGSWKVGTSVRVILDWKRRFDHMQQHSGQHLISDLFQYQDKSKETLSWWLAEDFGLSYIELESKASITDEELSRIENEANEAIRSRLPVKVDVYDDIRDPELQKATTRGLPDDLEGGPIRVVTMLSRSNMCCGTHVTNLSELQIVKLTSSEMVKKKCLVYFLVGNRVLKHLSDCLSRERKLVKILNNAPSEHEQLVERAIKSSKALNKTVQILIREAAAVEAEKIKKCDPVPKFHCCYKKEGDGDFISTLVNELSQIELRLLFVVVGDDKLGPCQIALVGDPDAIAKLGPKILELLNGKGGGKGKRMNAKVSSLKNLGEANNLIEKYYSAED